MSNNTPSQTANLDLDSIKGAFHHGSCPSCIDVGLVLELPLVSPRIVAEEPHAVR